MANVIFTADDFGVVPGIDEGIRDAVAHGHINSVAAFGNAENISRKLANLQSAANGHPLEIGCHLTLTSGPPLTNGVAWMVDNHNQFYKYTQHRRPTLTLSSNDRNAIKAELNAQIDAINNFGTPVRHLSSHHNTLVWWNDYFEIYNEISRERNIPARTPTVRPENNNNNYLKTIGWRSRFRNSKHFDRLRMQFFEALDPFLSGLRQANALRMPTAADSRAYGPLATFAPTPEAYLSQSAEKFRMVSEELNRLSTSNETVEFMFHIIEDDYLKLNEFRKSARFKNSRYKGINPGYFDRRVLERMALRQLAGHRTFQFASWDTV